MAKRGLGRTSRRLLFIVAGTMDGNSKGVDGDSSSRLLVIAIGMMHGNSKPVDGDGGGGNETRFGAGLGVEVVNGNRNEVGRGCRPGQSLALGQGLAEAAQGRQEQGAENSTHREGFVVLWRLGLVV